MIREMIAAFKRYWAPSLKKIDALDMTRQDAYIEKPISIWIPEDAPCYRTKPTKPADFAVTGAPRHIRWSVRKKELEASARQKRRQLESFREEA